MTAKKKKPLYKDLFFQVIVAIILGILLGVVSPETGVAMKPLGDAFINLIKMMIAPIIFCTIVTGVAGMGNMRQAGRVGIKSLIYFEIITTFALIMGLVAIRTYEPGVGMHVDAASLDAGAVAAKTGGAKLDTMGDFLLHMIPDTFVGAFVHGEILQVLVIALLFSGALVMMGDKAKPIVQLIDQFSHAMFGCIGIITVIAPVGAFGAMAFTIGKFGLGSLVSLGNLILGFYITCALFVVVVLGLVLKFYCNLSIFKFLAFIKDELMIVFGTSSSETVLPRMIDKLTHLGCAKPVVGMVIPTGYSFNLDGTSIYLTMAAIFVAQALDVQLTLSQELGLLGVLLLTSKGAAGVTGSGFVVLAATMASVGDIPVAGLALILGIDRFMSAGRAITNLIGNGVATIVVAKWENALDEKRAAQILSGKKAMHLETDPIETF